MNKIFKVIYSKTKRMYVVASELAKSHSKSKNEGAPSGKALAALVMAALASVSFMVAPLDAQAADKTDTTGWKFIGIWHNSTDESNTSENYQSHDIAVNDKGAIGEHSITIGVHTQAGPRTIVIGDRLASTSQDSVFIGSGYDANGVRQQAKGGIDVVVIGSSADATGTGSIALGYGATADPWKNVSDTDKKNANKNGQSIAFGYNAQAENNNIAIGANSVATAAASTENAKFRDTTASDYKAPTSYVSVGSSTNMRRITNVAAGSDANDAATVGQLEKVAAQKGSWQLTAGKTNATTVDGDNNTVDFSAGSDGNLSVSKTADTNDVTIGLKKDVILGQATSGNGGSLDVYRAVGDASSDKETNEHNQSYDQLGSHVRIDGSTVSVHYDNGTDSDARGAVMGIANDSYKDTNDATKTVSSPLGYVYLQDGKNYYYLHGAMHGDTNYQGRLAYDSSESGYNYIANLDDGLKFTGDTANTTVETKLDPNAANNTLSIKGGVTDSSKLTSGNIGVVAKANTAEKGNVTSAGGLTIQLAKDLTGITSITSQTTDNTKGAKVTLDTENGDINVNNGKVTGLGDGTVGATSTDAVTGKQLYNLDNSSVKYDTKDDKTVDKTKITLGDGTNDTTVTHVKSALADAKDSSGKAATIATATGDALKNAVNLGDLQTAYTALDSKAGAHTALTVEGGTQANGEKDKDSKNLYAGKNIQLHSDTDATTGKVTYDVKLAKDLTGITSISNQTTTGDKTTGAKITLNTDGSTDFNGGKITNIASNATKGADGKYTVADADKNNAASMSDVQNLIKDATDAANTGLAGKANITADNIGANLKDDKGNKASGDEIRTNENDWGKAIGTGVIADPTKTDKNDPEKNGSEQLVTGGTVYKALNGGLTKIVIGTPGEPGKDGAPGTIGLVGPAGTNGKDGAVDITIQKGKDDDAKGIKGANGVDGKDGITRIVYTDAAGDHQAATMEDGMKFAGDDGQTSADKVIAKKLNNTIDIIGGADSKKLTDKNIGVNNVGGKLKIQLAQNLTGITSIGNQKTTGEGKDATTTGAKITLDDNDKNISVNGGSIKEVASNLKDGKLIDGSANNAASISDVQTLVQQGVDNGYTNGDGITIQKDQKTNKNVISINKGDGLKFDNGKLAVNTGDGLTIDETTKALKIKTSDSNLKVDQNGIGLNNVITIGKAGTDAHPITIDGTKGEVSGLNNTSWDSTADYSKSTKAATESQVAKAMNAAVDQAGKNDVDTHVKAGTYAVDKITTADGMAEQGVSLNIVGKDGQTTGTVTIKDIAKASDVGDISGLANGVKNADGTTTTVVDAINNVNTKIGDQQYYKGDDKGHTVKNGDSITSAIGKLDGAIQTVNDASSAANNIKGDSNIAVTDITDDNGKVTGHQVSLNKDISVDSVKAGTTTTNTLTVNESATIGSVTIANKTISGLDDTKIEKDSPNATNAVNERTIYNELRPTSDGSYIKQSSTTAQNLTNLDTQVKKTADLINSDGKTIKIGSKDAATKIDVSDKDGNGRTITGVVTDGSDTSSAANVGYVNDVAAANTQQIYRDMNSAYGHLNNNINKAAAGSNALAALHPLDYDPADKASYAVGYGHYRNANAAAIGAFYQPNANTMVSVGVSMGNGDPGVNAGVSFKVGKGSTYNGVSKAQMAETIAAQEKQISEIKASDAAKDKRIDSLEKENQEMKKQIQEILAKLGK